MPEYFEVTVASDETVSVEVLGDILPPGGSTGQVLMKLSGANYHVAWAAVDALARPTEFDTIEIMLAEPTANWFRARVFNSYEAPVLTYWDLVLIASTGGAALTPNGDSILATDDGLGYAVRTQSIPQ